jgi:4-hydroxy-tetrahydrodipicolinate synthase
MVTPFTSGGAIDEDAVGRIVDYLVGARVAGIFPLGTTGESSSIQQSEKRRLVAATVKHVAGRATVYVGISGNCLKESVETAKAYQQLGVAAAVAHVASYYPLNDAEIEAYFARLADEVPLPLVLYNIPVTTHHSISLEVVVRLKQHPNIVALKDSSGDAPRLTDLLARTGGRGGFPILLGSSAVFAHGLRLGAVGLVPSGAHVIADKYQAMYEAAMGERWDEVEQLGRETNEVVSGYLKGKTLGQGLAVLKAMMEKRGLCGRTMLPPLLDYAGAV